MSEIQITRPSNEEARRYIKIWDSLENYVLQENSLNKLFLEVCPNNTEIEDILIKASTLNDFYSTNIFSIFPVAKHILELDIDSRLKAGDPMLVEEIARVQIKDSQKNFYSFATKYCSHHNPEAFPIYDSYVEKVLLYFKKESGFRDFTTADLKEYPTFKSILLDFAKYYSIDLGLKDLDRYLWLLGKRYFPKDYSKGEIDEIYNRMFGETVCHKAKSYSEKYREDYIDFLKDYLLEIHRENNLKYRKQIATDTFFLEKNVPERDYMYWYESEKHFEEAIDCFKKLFAKRKTYKKSLRDHTDYMSWFKTYLQRKGVL